MIHRRALATLLALALPLAARAAPANPRVRIDTDMGPIVVEVDVAHAPVTAGNFLAYVDRGLFKGASFYRAVRADNDHNPAKIAVIQGGLGDGPSPLPPIAHETTQRTGLKHRDGTISMARDAPGTATSEFFIVIGDAPALDYGGARNPDGQGFAAFGRVVQGMEVVRRIDAAPVGEGGAMPGQMLAPPVRITAVRRVR